MPKIELQIFFITMEHKNYSSNLLSSLGSVRCIYKGF